MGADRLIAMEQYWEILTCLTPGQLIVLSLYLDLGMSQVEIAEYLGVTRQAVSIRFNRAAMRVAKEFPELAYEGRRAYNRPGFSE